jgi:AcrR family transcriptional regulator
MVSGTRRDARVNATREALLSAAERLFAERGVHAVANREISLAAGQGNNAAVTYHFGNKADVVRAIARRHAEPIGRRREQMLAVADGSTDARDWVACLVLPLTEHLAKLGSPTWYARFTAQVRADPALSEILTKESLDTTPALVDLQGNLARCLPDLPEDVRLARAMMARHLVIQMAVEHERALAEQDFPPPGGGWDDLSAALIDAIVGMWQAPVGMRA